MRAWILLTFVGALAHCDAFGSDSSPAPARDASVDPPPVVDPDASRPEAAAGCGHCRSGHCELPGGGCDPLVFVTPAAFKGDLGASTGAKGAARGDEICTQVGGTPGTFRAWLSDSTAAAVARVASHGVKSRPLWLPDGTMVAASLNQLLADEKPTHAIDRTFQGALPATTRVWTGTKTDGSATFLHCDGWTTPGGVLNATATGTFGVLEATTKWTAATALGNPNQLCSDDLHLYCFEVVEP